MKDDVDDGDDEASELGLQGADQATYGAAHVFAFLLQAIVRNRAEVLPLSGEVQQVIDLGQRS